MTASSTSFISRIGPYKSGEGVSILRANYLGGRGISKGVCGDSLWPLTDIIAGSWSIKRFGDLKSRSLSSSSDSLVRQRENRIGWKVGSGSVPLLWLSLDLVLC